MDERAAETAISEDRFQDLVAMWLADSFTDVTAEVTLESGHRPDFIAHTPFRSYVIEVENDWDSIYDGLGQSVLYGAETGYERVLVFPAERVDADELALLTDYEHAPHIETV